MQEGSKEAGESPIPVASRSIMLHAVEPPMELSKIALGEEDATGWDRVGAHGPVCFLGLAAGTAAIGPSGRLQGEGILL